MDLVFDTNLLIEFERGNAKIIKELDILTKKYGSNIFITSPSLSEFFYGIIKRNKNRKLALDLIEDYKLLNTSKSSSIIFAELKYKLEKEGKQAQEFDLMIASICISEGKTIVTLDQDFSNIKELNSIILKI